MVLYASLQFPYPVSFTMNCLELPFDFSTSLLISDLQSPKSDYSIFSSPLFMGYEALTTKLQVWFSGTS